MKTILQTVGEPDCGAACVAMLLGWKLSEARKQIYGSGNARNTSHKELNEVLRKNGLSFTGSRLKRLGRNGLQALKSDAIVFGKRNHGGGHWMVWDSRQKCLRDPSGFRSSIKITSYLSIKPL